MSRIYDSNYTEWNVGDSIIWLDDYYSCEKQNVLPPSYSITKIDKERGFIYWNVPGSDKVDWTPWYNLMRVAQN